MKKSVFILVLSIVLSLSVVSGAFASSANSAQSNSFDIVAAKKALAKQHQSEYNPKLTNSERKAQRDQVSNILLKMTAEGKSIDEMSAALKPYHTYILKQPQQTKKTTMSADSQPSDVTMNSPTITYDSTNQEWVVTGGGYWTNNGWLSDETLPTPAGSTNNLGYYDTVGLSYYNTGGTYNTGVIQQTGYWTSRDSYISPVTTHSSSGGNGSNGVYFMWQDYVKCDSYNAFTDNGTWSYLGDGFSAQIVYNSNFANYNGNAVAFYGHTWNTTTISSVSLNVSTSPGFTINFSSSSNKFAAQSTDGIF